MTQRILILGGTTEARLLSERLARDTGFDVTLSLAGRTKAPVAHPVPVRTGGFGGADGLANYLREHRIAILVDATHPFAARMSANAARAAGAAGIPLLALRRPEWRPAEGDRWTIVDSVSDAVVLLGSASRRVFVALGRQELEPLARAPQHNYLVRSVDPVEPPLDLPSVDYLLGRGPFAEVDERAILETHRINAIIAKNSGGDATYGKIAAARALRIEVFIVRRPALPEVAFVVTVDEAVEEIAHLATPVAERGE